MFHCTDTPDIALGTSVLYLVPGIPYINSVSDLIHGHLLCCISRFIEASVLTACLGIGLSVGNHECQGSEDKQIKAALREMGATVLEGDSVELGGIRIAGTDDPLCLTRADWQAQIEGCRAQDEIFTVLMAHRPDRADSYATGFDLVVSGHAHGGQICIPGLLDGLWAPNQGWFPEYTSGLYPLEEGQLAVSRGLCKSAIPRLFNRPELMILHIVPEKM